MRFLSPAEYGIFSLIEGFVYIATTITGVGLRKLLALEYVHHSQNDQKKITNAIIITHLCLALPVLGFLLIYRATILRVVFNDAITVNTFMFVLVMIFCSFFCELLYQILRFTHQAKTLSLIHIFHACSIAVITVSCFLFFKVTFIAIPASQGITMIFVMLIAIRIWLKSEYAEHVHIKNALQKSRWYMYASMPLMVGTLLQWVLESSDRWMIARLGSMHDVGIYSAAYLFNGFFYSLVVLPWTGAYVPYILQKYAQNRDNVASVEYSNRRFMWITMLVLVIVLVVSITVAKPFILMLLPTAYHNAFSLIAPMVLGRIIYFGAQFNLCLLQFYKKAWVIFLILFISALVNVICNYLLIPYYGLYASVVVSIVSFTLYFIITWYCNKKIMDGVLSEKLPDQLTL